MRSVSYFIAHASRKITAGPVHANSLLRRSYARGKMATAKKLLLKGTSIDEIAEITGLYAQQMPNKPFKT
ncbi:hypothetical protein [Desulfosporosinus acididurans]|uniref:hypothetical protein n=1 Tax=Desulfosporosinus acididurans TaxID=476652 RepID=UPI000649E27E|nr:hypothetical protein [Desulfosporosinus acididurans]